VKLAEILKKIKKLVKMKMVLKNRKLKINPKKIKTVI